MANVSHFFFQIERDADMIRNFLTVGLRNLRQQPLYSVLNILGLAVGITCMLLAVLYTGHQFSFDRHHEKSDRIYRVIRKLQDAGGERYDLGTKPVAPHLRGRFPEVEAVTRMLIRRMWASHEDGGADARVCVTDAEVFDVFTFPMVAGDPETGLNDPQTAFLSETLARRLFGDEDPIGRTVNIHYKWFKDDFTVTGILKDQPKTSNDKLRFDFLTTTYPERSDKYPANRWRDRVWEEWPSNWFIGPLRTYVLLHQGADVAELEEKLHAFAAAHQIDDNERYDYYLQPLNRIHLYSRQDYGTAEVNAGDIGRCYMLLFVGMLVLVIACINYVNLVTARSARRLREVGLRKVTGATRLQLMGQFLSESLLIVLFAGLLAVTIASDAISLFNELMGVDLHLSDAGSGFVLALSFCVLLGTGLFAGSYPAFVFSAFDPVRALKGTQRFRRAGLSQAMVVVQFGISVVLIITTLVVYHQLAFVRSKELGFEKEHIVMLPFFLRDRGLRPTVNTILNETLAQPGVLQASAFHTQPGRTPVDRRILRAEGRGDAKIKLYWNGIDDNYLDLFGLTIVSGRNLVGMPEYREIGENRWEEFALINETAAREVGWDDPVGRAFFSSDGHVQTRVIGVVKDYHNKSLHQGITPMLLQNSTSLHYVGVRLAPGDLGARLAGLESVWKRFLPTRPFEYKFLDRIIDGYYRSEVTLQKVCGVFAALSIFISCLGMLGLIAFAVQQRTKEIGIRKVVGASEAKIVLLLTRDFLILAFIANLIGWPVAYFLMSSWLNDFAYRIALDPLVFVGTGVLTLGIVLVTVCGQAWRAACANPVDAIRVE